MIKIIAEAGVNHNGSIDIAKKLIDKASEAGADYVKFQTFKTENVLIRNAEKAEYQKNSTNINESQFEMIKKLELNKSDHIELIEYCKEKNIIFISTPFDNDSIDLLKDLDIPLFKIPSGEITNLPYLRYIGEIGKPIIMSTGMANLQEVKDAVGVLINAGSNKEDISLLHCNTEYPTPFIDVNLSAIITMRNEIGVEVGYSDHTLGIEIPIAAAALGCKIIEKHFTLDRSFLGPDHAASLMPGELNKMVSSIRNIEKAIGDGKKRPTPSETKNISVARKSLVAKRKIKIGDRFTEDNLTIKRPGTGISPMYWDSYMGKISKKKYDIDDLI